MSKIVLILCINVTLLFALDTLYIRPPQSTNDISHDYYYSLLQLVMDKTEATYGKTVVLLTTKNMSQMRALTELEKGEIIDVDWAGTSIEREKRLGTIFIPLNKGLLGYRVPVIRTSDSLLFSSLTTKEKLRTRPCIQGSHWPDSDILEAADFSVIRTPLFKSMYPMLINKRADWFPRGINEVYAEISSFDNEVIAFDKIIIAYPFPMYFFVQRERTTLKKRIETGLRTALHDGSFDQHMKNHKAFSSVFPLERFDKSHIIRIDNPFLSKETPLKDSSLWLQLGNMDNK